MRAPLALALACAALGCAVDDADYHGDETFTEAERAEIERGNAFVAERLGVAPYRIVWDAPHRPYPLPGELGRVEPVGGEAGYFYQGRLVIGPERAGSALAAVAAHEMAHARGVQHHAGVGSMVETLAPGAELMWTADDARAARVR